LAGSGAFFIDPRRSLRQNGLGGACLVLNE
jgi:hypothetical protein